MEKISDETIQNLDEELKKIFSFGAMNIMHIGMLGELGGFLNDITKEEFDKKQIESKEKIREAFLYLDAHVNLKRFSIELTENIMNLMIDYFNKVLDESINTMEKSQSEDTNEKE